MSNPTGSYELVPPVKTERARARAPVKLSNAETALSKQQPRPGPYYPPLCLWYAVNRPQTLHLVSPTPHGTWFSSLPHMCCSTIFP